MLSVVVVQYILKACRFRCPSRSRTKVTAIMEFIIYVVLWI